MRDLKAKHLFSMGVCLILAAPLVDAQCDTPYMTNVSAVTVEGCYSPAATLDFEIWDYVRCLDSNWKADNFPAGWHQVHFYGTCERVDEGDQPECLGGWATSGLYTYSDHYTVAWEEWDGYLVDGVCEYGVSRNQNVDGSPGSLIGCCSDFCNQPAECAALGHDFYGCSCYAWCSSDGLECTSGSECCSGLCEYNDTSERRCGHATPILLNLGGSSRPFDLTTAAGGVTFDIDGDGDANQVAWTEGASDVAFLAMDRNGNGTIDNGAELFGNATLLSGGGTAENGFQALAELDSNHDGAVDRHDSAYWRLLLWLDSNHNGLSERSELRSLTEVGITALSTDYRESRRTDRNGNELRYLGRAMISKDGHRFSVPMVDVILQSTRLPTEAGLRMPPLRPREVDFCR